MDTAPKKARSGCEVLVEGKEAAERLVRGKQGACGELPGVLGSRATSRVPARPLGCMSPRGAIALARCCRAGARAFVGLDHAVQSVSARFWWGRARHDHAVQCPVLVGPGAPGRVRGAG
jgi:hypothetical protein